ncbi:MOSC domain-containing protein [Leekyejoonella antrihumi]|uniref:MOSC domain-containing protein n=1 Tax=Leekyejoonella antrihumi TaxID=1660198 RepID=A0A563DRI1_9MICO|nr:MOSC domain-containing protein [Leekyejoonella antrihumi]TWP32563.1 MOSC domain-containing protein [Leekyejoonella antrihumi]
MDSGLDELGSVTALQVTATKGFSLRHVDVVDVTPTGIAGNREFFLVDVDGRLYSVPKDPVFLAYWTLYDRGSNTFSIGQSGTTECASVVRHVGTVRPFTFDDRTVYGWWTPGPWDEWFSRRAGRNLRLAQCAEPGGGYDVYPVTLQSTASLSALGNELDGRPVDPDRFRLNITVDVGDLPFVEDTWEGQILTAGTCRLGMRSGIPRCLAVESRPADADRGLQMQRRIREVRGPTPSKEWGPAVLFGVYAEVVDPGRVATGDPVFMNSGRSRDPWPS